MEINLLRAFLALVETPNFGRASALLNLSQPALSRQLGKLEAQLGGDRVGPGAGREPAALGLGEQQMVSIARGVSLGARVLILDEPTSALSGA
ncbi:LysR family transcriptional regulator, partial [Burkholderia gladioli]|nr:LysR family transcriptional regulator [Burkholderia gladioli]